MCHRLYWSFGAIAVIKSMSMLYIIDETGHLLHSMSNPLFRALMHLLRMKRHGFNGTPLVFFHNRFGCAMDDEFNLAN